MGSLAGEQAQTLSVPLRFLERRKLYVANIYGDAPTTDLETNPNEVQISRLIVDSRDSLIAGMTGAAGKPCTSRRRARTTHARSRGVAMPRRSARPASPAGSERNGRPASRAAEPRADLPLRRTARATPAQRWWQPTRRCGGTPPCPALLPRGV